MLTWQTAVMKQGKESLWEQVKDDPELASYWKHTGHYEAASTNSGLATLAQIEQKLKQEKIDYKPLNSTQREHSLGTGYYQGAL